MQVFKAFMKIVKSNWSGILLYFGICVIMTVMVASQYGEKESNGGFVSTNTSIIVNDEDNSELSKAVVKYLKSTQKVSVGKYSDDSVKDIIYSGYYTAYIDIPKGFMDKHLSEDALEISTVFDTSQAAGNFVSLQLSSFVDGILRFENAGFSMEEAISKTEEAVDTDNYIELEVVENQNRASNSKSYSLFLFLPYAIMSIILWCLLPAVLRFNVKDVKDRTDVSPISSTSRNIALFGGSCFISLLVFVGIVIFTGVFLKGDIFTEKWYLSILNLFIFTLVTGGMLIFITSFPTTSVLKGKDIIVNIVSLGFSFLGGIFVPLKILGDGVKSVGRFLPTYWYAVSLEKIESGVSFNGLLGSFGMEALFGVFCLAAGLAVSRVSLYVKDR
ncbi:MAG: ABC transporter permease [Lachnospiraceae bacterium]|nr:ABC transporter permease [Lachnospiraceae bacterium]